MPNYVDYTTVPHLANVELATAGMEWPASTGPVTFTMEHLADAVTAANEDPHIREPRLKLGHRSEVNGELLTINPFEALGDAAPAFGKVTNLRLENDGAVLVGDYVEVPEWLATAMPSAYPNRSGDWFMDVETAGGKRYLLVLAAMSLLGTSLPAVTDLADLERFIEGGPEALQTNRRASVPAETSVSIDRVRRAFNFEWATSDPVEDLDTYWWWVRDIRVDPDEVIADDDEGNLWRVPFTTDGEEGIEFSEPERVREVYVPAATSGANAEVRLIQTAPVRTGQRVLATSLDRPEKQQPSTAATAADAEEATVPIDMDALRRRLELPDDADETAINEALTAVEPEPETPDEPETTDPPEGEPEATPDEPQAETVTVSRQVWEDTQGRLATVETSERERTERETRSRRDGLVETAVREGRIAPAERDHYRSMLDINEQQTSQLLTTLAAGRVPVAERGATETSTSEQNTGTGWFPQLEKQEA